MEKAIIKRIDVYQVSESCWPGDFVLGRFEQDRKNVLVRIAVRIGSEIIEGWGEAAPADPALSGQTREIIADDVERRAAPEILGQAINSTDDVLKIVKKVGTLRRGMTSAVSAVDCALFDVLGKIIDKPVFQIIREHVGFAPVPRLKSVKSSEKSNSVTLRINQCGGFAFLAELLNHGIDLSAFKAVFCSMNETAIGACANFHAALTAAEFIYDTAFCDMDGTKKPIRSDMPVCLSGTINYPGDFTGWNRELETQLNNFIPERFPVKNSGLGIDVNPDYIEIITEKASTIIKKDGRIVIRRFPYSGNKPDVRKVSEEIL